MRSIPLKLGQVARIAKGDEWIIPRYEEYLKSRDPQAEIDFMAQIMSRPDRDRSVGWSASSSGSCLRAQQFRARKAPSTPPEPKGLNIFANGHFVHLRHQVAGLVYGYLTEVEVPVRIENLGVLGTMDGLTVLGEVAEFKSINSRGFASVRTFGAKEEHIRQVNAYMLASDTTAARIVYENKDDNTLKEFKIERDQQICDELERTWERMNEMEETGELMPILRECQNLEGRYRWCPYAKTCLEEFDKGR